jgi:hypothetical protein
MTGFGLAPTKPEGRVSDPDAHTWACYCDTCKARRLEWRKKYQEDQQKIAEAKLKENNHG